MTCKDFIITFEILQKYLDNNPVCGNPVYSYAEHDEYGFCDLPGKDVMQIDDIKTLRNIGWLPGSDYELDENDLENWKNPNTSDSCLLEIWDTYKSIYTYA